tara:strand:+ start:13163 stop:14362 length:1200 start_codon:yes stop_codon:yes gene_type:complete
MNIKIISNQEEYQQTKKYFDSLIEQSPDLNADLIEVLALLIEQYEKEEFNLGMPDPIEAIEFRMEQQGLTKRDLIPFLGTQSRVSEILNRKKPLSLSMIKSLHKGLGISYKVLMQEQKYDLDKREVEYTDFPVKAMFKQGFFGNTLSSTSEALGRAEEAIKGLFEPVGMDPFGDNQSAHLRSNAPHFTNSKMDRLALRAWQAKVLNESLKTSICKCDLDLINRDFMNEILKLSRLDNGPLIAKQELANNGIHLIFEKHLPKTYLDGAAMWGVNNNPVIGMTVRYDRLDNFWFVLMHELAHVSLHLKGTSDIYFDDVETSDEINTKEDEADQLALNALMPQQDWQMYFDILTSPKNVKDLAKKLSVNPAIIAGRYRKEAKDYRIFNRLIGNKEVRELVFD